MTDDSNIHKYYTIYTYIDIIVYNTSILMQLLAIISMFYRSM